VADTTVGFQFEASLRVCGSVGSEVEESTLLAGLRRGDEAAYEVLIQRYEKPVYALVARLVDDPSDAADAVQEVVSQSLPQDRLVSRESSLKTWIYRIAVNEARNQRRWFGRHRKGEVGLDPLPGESVGCGDWLEDPRRSPYQICARSRDTGAY